MSFGKVTSIYYYLMTHTSVYPTVEKILKLFLKKRSSTTSKQNIHIKWQRTRLCKLQMFLSMYFVYGLKTLKSCLAICSLNITLKKCVHGSFFIMKITHTEIKYLQLLFEIFNCYSISYYSIRSI